MSISTMTSKGQTTIPKDIRDRLGLRAGDRLHLTLLADGTVLLRAKTRSVKDAAGILHKPGRKPVSISAMKAWR